MGRHHPRETTKQQQQQQQQRNKRNKTSTTSEPVNRRWLRHNQRPGNLTNETQLNAQVECKPNLI